MTTSTENLMRTDMVQHQMVRPVLLTRRQVAEMLGLCERTIFTLTKSGELKCRKVGTKAVRYRLADVQEFADRDPS